MILSKITDYLYGFVYFKSEGGFPERFINLCRKENIYLWNIKIENSTLSACCDIKDYKKIRIPSKKTGMKTKIIKKSGLPFFLHRHRHRVAIPIAGFVFILVCAFFSRFIWTINVSGNKTVPSEDIIAVFEEMGIKPGTLKSSVNAGFTAEQSLLKLDNVSWASINIKGCSAQIEIKEKTPLPEIKEKSLTPSNIVSSRSGVIRKFELYDGTACVQSGDAVCEGDILVTGAVTNKNTSVSFIGADAYISAETSRDITSSSSYKRKNLRIAKIKKRYSVNFFTLRFPVSFLFLPKGEYDYFRDENSLTVNDIKMPVSIICEYYLFYEPVTVTADRKTALSEAEQEYLEKYRKTFSDKKILTDKITKSENNNSVGIFGEYTCIEKIGVSKPMDIDLSENVYQESN